MASWSDFALIAGDAKLSATDSVDGASLLRSTDLAAPKLELRTWTLSDEGAFSAKAAHVVPWGDATSIEDVRVAVGPKGAAAALLRDGEGQWFVFDSVKGLRPASWRFEKTDLTIAVAYFASGDPVLIVAGLEGGFEMLDLDGQPLAPPAG